MSYTSTISIHSLRVEGDKTSTSCAGGKYISIHSLRVEGDLINAMHLNTSKISIHSLRVEGDWYAFVRLFVSGLHFNPLPPCGGRPIRNLHSMIFLTFQSTPSVWRETTTAYGELPVITDFNPLPPCGGRPLFASIRVPHFVFQSTPSVWRETRCFLSARSPSSISIHSLRVEGDEKIVWRCAISWTFQSTPSVWRETLWHIQNVTESIFQSTPSVWRETYTSFIVVVSLTFQSTPSVWRETIDGYKNVDRLKHFNPLPPCGGRQIRMINYDVATHFNPLPPCGGRPECLIKASRNVVFQSTPSVWRETRRRLAAQVFMRNFNPLPPCGGRPCSYYYSIKIRNISIHSIRVEGDRPQRRP